MTDYEMLTGMFMRTGIPFETKTPPSGTGSVVTVIADDEKVLGYTGFVTEFQFTADEQLVGMGIWE